MKTNQAIFLMFAKNSILFDVTLGGYIQILLIRTTFIWISRYPVANPWEQAVVSPIPQCLVNLDGSQFRRFLYGTEVSGLTRSDCT